MDTLKIDPEFLERLEAGLQLRQPASSAIPVRVLGYGEISTVLAVEAPEAAHVALKRMPMFLDDAEVAAYESLYAEYVNLLNGAVGVRVVPSRTVRLGRHRGKVVVYIAQERLPRERVAQAAIPQLSARGLGALLRSALTETERVFAYNAAQKGTAEIAIDGQISNWAFRSSDAMSRLDAGETVPLDYLDTSTPLLRKAGVEQLDPELFLRSAPSFLVWIIRMLFLEDVLTRYYDLRKVAIDMIANFYKEGRSADVPSLIETANDWFAQSAFPQAPLSVHEVQAYYREDALIWRIYLGSRKIDRFLHGILGKDYPYMLPDKVKR